MFYISLQARCIFEADFPQKSSPTSLPNFFKGKQKAIRCKNWISYWNALKDGYARCATNLHKESI